ncbi:hypothetical protein AAG570_001215 [Ranatra chinensis]|uniref:Uncharacterized protein n=1 Tax=Ranatra chinensis TaxID=642074 RepID=A0ABD0YB86_9HEMI
MVPRVLLLIAVLARAEDIFINVASGDCPRTIVSPRAFRPNSVVRINLNTQPGYVIQVFCHGVTMLTKNTLRQGISCADFVLAIVDGSLRNEYCGRGRSLLYTSKKNEVIIEARTGLKGSAEFTCLFEAITN